MLLIPAGTRAQRRAEVLVEPTHPWRRATNAGGILYAAGDEEIAGRILNAQDLTREPLTALLLQQGSQFAAVMETEQKVLACVDAVRSVPLFYAETEAGLVLSNDPRRLIPRVSGTLDTTSIMEMYHAGYVTGEHTLYEGVVQLQAGNALLYDIQSGELVSWAYHKYLPRLAEEVEGAVVSRVEALGAIVDKCFRRIIERVGDREVYLPLSGGLDSRLVACKLHELGFKRIRAFTYGPPGNSQAIVAREVAERLDLQWSQIPFDIRRMREIFRSEDRVSYQRFADGLSTVPSMSEFCPLIQLGCTDPASVVVVNGQSGDFICGNHLPLRLVGESDDSMLWDQIRSKHFGVRPQGAPGLHPVEERFAALYENLSLGDGFENPLATRHENWEFQERQAKYVVNGQRLYEFLGMDWLLPWWDFELIQFFQGASLVDYARRELLQAYLRSYDYRGLFKSMYPSARAYTGLEGLCWDTGIRGLRLIVGRAPASLLQFASYRTGYYRSYFQLYSLAEFLRRSRSCRFEPQARNATGVMIDQWFEDQGLPNGLEVVNGSIAHTDR